MKLVRVEMANMQLSFVGVIMKVGKFLHKAGKHCNRDPSAEGP